MRRVRPSRVGQTTSSGGTSAGHGSLMIRTSRAERDPTTARANAVAASGNRSKPFHTEASSAATADPGGNPRAEATGAGSARRPKASRSDHGSRGTPRVPQRSVDAGPTRVGDPSSGDPSAASSCTPRDKMEGDDT